MNLLLVELTTIYLFIYLFLDFVSIVVKATKFEKQCHISNQLFLI